MRILRAQIDGFGRYSNRTFEFGEGINVIYGNNEAGKSTLQHFMLAMLFGMKKPGRKRAVYLEEEQKYRPWHGGPYGGILWLEAEGVVYRIERNLRREDEWVRIYRDDTGEEVTGRYPVDSRKEPTFALQVLHTDRDLFVHTLCIGPIDERERLQLLRGIARQGDSGADGLSMPEQQGIRQAEEAIQKRLDVIGSERAASKPYAGALKTLDDTKRAYHEALQREESQRAARTSAEGAAVEWEEARRDEQVLREELTRRLSRYLYVQETRRVELHDRLEQLDSAIEANGQRAELEMDEAGFREIQSDFQQLLMARRDLDTYQKRLDTVLADSKEATEFAVSHPTIEDHGLQLVERTAQNLEQIEQKIEHHPPERDASQYEEMEGTYRSKRRLMFLVAALGLVIIPFSLSQYWALLLVAFCFAYAALNYFAAKSLAAELVTWQAETEEQAALIAADHAEQQRLEALLLDLLTEFSVDTPRQYRQKWTQLVTARERMAAAEKQSQWLQSEVNRAKGARDILARRLLRRIGGDEEQAKSLDADRLAQDIAAWEARCNEAQEIREQLHVWQRERDRVAYELELLEQGRARWQEVEGQLGLHLGESNLFAELEQEAAEGSEESQADLDKLYQSWQAAERIFLNKKAEFSEADTRYQTMSEGQASPADLLLLMEDAQASVEQLSAERDALLIAQQVFGEVKDEMYQAIAPRFTSALADVSERVTQGRYSKIHLDRDDNVTAVSPDSGHTVHLGSLSEGTVDQITFALGLALSGWTIPGGEAMPLLLDEPFRRYDDQRLQEVLAVLLEEAEQRQILLFTCREQEVERAEALGGERVRLVELNDVKYGMIRS